jgi:hypothetical protein
MPSSQYSLPERCDGVAQVRGPARRRGLAFADSAGIAGAFLYTAKALRALSEMVFAIA